MNYEIRLTEKSEKDLRAISKSGDKVSLKKLLSLIEELKNHPRRGSGKPEKLKFIDGEVWSRRINKKDRLIYEIYDKDVLVLVISALGHYQDK
ncbi:Txe/YoeB family addiction module toxin [Chryseobacterium taklimakanense]|uniref:Txe/YoeB family addiction module toxin n=1 Tax=Chryseobacterium taklimakanense TaxID=536441 RepID=UPI000F5D61DD|nr:Txe/YoeB family addiction module toxin [Chryseobacterium taklimakanense]AZI22968.1 Txe/YoeB family addiction module toxin [Chryseobacterium taklimakanense]